MLCSSLSNTSVCLFPHLGIQVVVPLEGVRRLPAGVPCPPFAIPKRWLNVILDLNKILCVCEDFRRRNLNLSFNNCSLSHSPTKPAKAVSKLVYVHPGCMQFLQALSEFATISVWSSMRGDNVKNVTSYLFRNVVMPKALFGQEHCRRILTSIENNRCTYLKVKGSDKEVFLNCLQGTFFTENNDTFT